jgi:hypothetical protein
MTSHLLAFILSQFLKKKSERTKQRPEKILKRPATKLGFGNIYLLEQKRGESHAELRLSRRCGQGHQK